MWSLEIGSATLAGAHTDLTCNLLGKFPEASSMLLEELTGARLCTDAWTMLALCSFTTEAFRYLDHFSCCMFVCTFGNW